MDKKGQLALLSDLVASTDLTALFIAYGNIPEFRRLAFDRLKKQRLEIPVAFSLLLLEKDPATRLFLWKFHLAGRKLKKPDLLKIVFLVAGARNTPSQHLLDGVLTELRSFGDFEGTCALLIQKSFPLRGPHWNTFRDRILDLMTEEGASPEKNHLLICLDHPHIRTRAFRELEQRGLLTREDYRNLLGTERAAGNAVTIREKAELSELS